MQEFSSILQSIENTKTIIPSVDAGFLLRGRPRRRLVGNGGWVVAAQKKKKKKKKKKTVNGGGGVSQGKQTY